MGKYTYLLINICSIAIPLLFSFERRMRFYKNFSALFPALFITGVFFILWDHFMTIRNVWAFNPDFILGIYIWELPLEEWLFFFTIPYSCMFVYTSMNHLVKSDISPKISVNISRLLFVVVTVTAVLNAGKLYTGIKLSLTGMALLYCMIKNPEYMGKFYRSYLICLIPFFIVNGILTALPVVTYNNQENLGIRLGTIPVEDTMYMLLLLVMNTILFEFFKTRQQQNENTISY